MLDELRRSNSPAAVVSNPNFGEPVIRCELTKHGLADHLAFVMVSTDYSVRKPNVLLSALFDLWMLLMERSTNLNHRKGLVPALRWTARMWSLASMLLVLAFIVGERSLPSAPDEWLGFLFFPFGISVGMLLAWWNERIGGIITVGSLGMFYAIHFMMAGAFPSGWAWLVFAAPGFLFVLAWLLSRKGTPTGA